MNVLCIIHPHQSTDALTLSQYGIYLHNIGACIEFRDVYNLPGTIKMYDLVIILGSSFSVTDFDRYKWMSVEARFIENVIRSKTLCIGLCFGAQMIAKVLGGQIISGEGAFSEFTKKNIVTKNSVFNGKDSYNSFSGHRDYIIIPQSVNKVSVADKGIVDVFSYGDKSWGFQSHIEATPELLSLWQIHYKWINYQKNIRILQQSICSRRALFNEVIGSLFLSIKESAR